MSEHVGFFEKIEKIEKEEQREEKEKQQKDVAEKQRKAEIEKSMDARELHQELEIKKPFADWIREQIKQGCFEEGRDHTVEKAASEKGVSKGRPRMEYALSLSMAKGICMMSRSSRKALVWRGLVERGGERGGGSEELRAKDEELRAKGEELSAAWDRERIACDKVRALEGRLGCFEASHGRHLENTRTIERLQKEIEGFKEQDILRFIDTRSIQDPIFIEDKDLLMEQCIRSAKMIEDLTECLPRHRQERADLIKLNKQLVYLLEDVSGGIKPKYIKEEFRLIKAAIKKLNLRD